MLRRIGILLLALVTAGCGGSKDATGPKIGPPATLTILGGDAQVGDAAATLSAPLMIRVMDANQNPVPNVPVVWSASSGTVSSSTASTDASGSAQATWKLGTQAGSSTASALVPGLPAVTFNATVRAGPVAAVTVTAPSTSMNVGDKALFTAAAKDAYANPITVTQYTWSSTNTSVATVDGTGNVTAVAAGNATIAASTNGQSGNASVSVTIPNMTVIVTNQLVHSINVQINGTNVGLVNASSSAQFTGPRSAISVAYTLNRQQTTQGTPVGETMTGIFNTVNNPNAVETFIVNNRLGNDVYFSPWIDNRTGTTFLMMVNANSPYENRCNCTVPPFTSNIDIGYYRTFPTTQVRAYGLNSNYTGFFVYWNYSDFSGLIAANSGITQLYSTVAPQTAGGIGQAAAIPSLQMGPKGASTSAQPLTEAEFRARPTMYAPQKWTTLRIDPPGIVTSKPNGQ